MKFLFTKFWSWLRSIKPQSAIALLCFAVLVTRFICPDLKFDNLSLDLILIAMLCILVPDLAALIARIKKFKFGDKEIELNEALDKMARQTEVIEDEVAKPGSNFFRTEIAAPQVERYIRDPRGGLIAVAADIERKVVALLKEHKLVQGDRYINPPRGIAMLADNGLVAQELPTLARDFWALRNQVVHTSNGPVTDREIYRMVDLGVRILDLLSASPAPIRIDDGHTRAGVETIIQSLLRSSGEETERDLATRIVHDFTTTLNFVNEGVRLGLLRRTQVRGLDGVSLTQQGKQYALHYKLS